MHFIRLTEENFMVTYKSRAVIYALVLTAISLSALSPFDSTGSFSNLFSSPAFAQEKDNGDPNYPKLGIRKGTWNDGQAALWDLNFLDHFHWFGPVERARGHKPEQPIKFSHVTHVQRNQMECQFCHWNVAKSSYAAIPEVETCWGCHKHVKGSDDQKKAEIAKLSEYVEVTTEIDPSTNGYKNHFKKPIPWVKVHVMPDHVRFNHKRHVKAGVACSSCHGQVPEMEVVERVSSMKMGWCISCHRVQGSNIDCNVCHY